MMKQTFTNGTAALQQRLEDPETAAALNRLLDRVDAIDRALASVSDMAEKAPGMFAMMADTMDGLAEDAARSGVDVDERLRNALVLAEKLTAPKSVEVLSALMDRMDRLEQLIALADQAPGLLALFVDVLDELARRAAEAGIDLEAVVRRGGHALREVDALVASGSFDAFMDSGVFDPRAVGIVGMLGGAMVKCQEECMSLPEPKRLGLFGALRAVKDPDVQRALAFLVNLGRYFGQGVKEKHTAHRSPVTPNP